MRLPEPLRRTTRIAVAVGLLFVAASCHGMFGGIYDEPENGGEVTGQQLYIDATSDTDWYYISFDSLFYLAEQGDAAALRYAQTHFTPYPVPTEEVAEVPADSAGLYTIWYDVYHEGLSVNERRGYRPTAEQPAPAQWDIAVHRSDVRTNGAAVLETNFTSMDELPAESSAFSGTTFTPDVWTDRVVWIDRSRSLEGLIDCQGININPVLTNWLRVDIPPIPPQFTLNNHVFIVRLRNGRYAAVQLQNYLNAAGTRCWLTINYKYPY